MHLLSPMQREALRGLADAVLPPPDVRRVTPARISHRIETFLDAVESPPMDLIRTMLDLLHPVVWLDNLDRTTNGLREKMREALSSPIEPIADAARIIHILISYVYYSEPEVDDQVGYVRFRSRPRGNLFPGTRTITPKRPIPQGPHDVVIVGSGVAGSVLAHRLARAGRRVLVLEAGSYYPEWHSTDDELLMLLRFYKSGIFQAAASGSLPVLQAQCVGGGGVINNAVCFKLPAFVKREWDGFGAALDDAALRSAFDHIGQELHIRPADQVMATGSEGHLNRSRELFLEGVRKLGIPHGTGEPDEARAGFYTCAVNLSECLGCGYCNIGCAYDRKNNALFKYLPEAIATGNCDLVAGVRVESVLAERSASGDLRAAGLRVRLATGEERTVAARSYILSAGAMASSGILLRSPLINDSGLPIGRRFSANVGSPLQARFAEKVDAYDGLQITDYFIEQDQDGSWGWLAETWFNPPATQSQAVPGYLETHFERMKKYAHYASVSPLVGSEPVGMVVLGPTGRAELRFTLSDADLGKLRRGLTRCAEIFLEAGAEEILLMARKDLILRSTTELGRIRDEIRQPRDLLVIGTGHPQGGNAMSDASVNGRRQGVVGTNFKVHGVEDLYVCDASVFPTSAKVNPQWTIMALADLCSASVLASS